VTTEREISSSSPTVGGNTGTTADPRAGDEPELTIVVMVLVTDDPAGLAAALSTYVVATRGRPGCRNVDWCQAVGTAGRFVIIEKWSSPQDQTAHFSSSLTEDLARSCRGLLIGPPQIELLESISAHDLA
jgi:quinol monooxygenase YgiN